MDRINYQDNPISRDTNNRRLQHFAGLKADWDGYGARPISKTAIGHARALLYEIRSAKWEPEIFPLADGGLQFEWNSEAIYLELEIHDNYYNVYALDEQSNDSPYGEDGKRIEVDPRKFVDVYLTKHFRL